MFGIIIYGLITSKIVRYFSICCEVHGNPNLVTKLFWSVDTGIEWGGFKRRDQILMPSCWWVSSATVITMCPARLDANWNLWENNINNYVHANSFGGNALKNSVSIHFDELFTQCYIGGHVRFKSRASFNFWHASSNIYT